MDNYKTRFLTISDLDAILTLQAGVFADLGHDSHLLRRNTREMFEACVADPNVTLGVFDGEELIGLVIMVDAYGTEEDLSLHLTKRYCENPRSVNFKLAMIRKQYYGNGFQRQMAKNLEEIARERGYNMMCATVSPDNLYSKNNILKSGYVVDHTEEKYGGLLRDVCVKVIL